MFMVLIVMLYGDVFGLYLAGSLAAFTLLHELAPGVTEDEVRTATGAPLTVALTT